MRILFLSHRLPYPPDHGAKIRAYYFIRHLSEKHSVTVASLAESEEELRQASGLRDACDDLIVEILPPRNRWLQALKAFPTSVPASVAYFWSDNLQRRIDERLHTVKFDAIFVFCAFAAQYVRRPHPAWKVLDYCDIDSAKWMEYSKYKAFPLSLGYALEAAKLRRYERGVAQQFDQSAVISPAELEEFKALDVHVPCSVIHNGVDASYFRQNQKKPGSKVIVFLGRMDYFPNVDGINFFAKEIFPLIRNKRPGAALRIVGSNPVKSVQELAKGPNVSVTGYVADVRQAMSDAAVSIAPLRIARGTQNKILESMAMGIPVVATSKAAKGLGVNAQARLLIADDRQTFADQVISVLDDDDLGMRLSAGGREYVEAELSWSNALLRLDDLLAKAGITHEKCSSPPHPW